jgi:2-iminobutanoate/2-iminopropanoate deaminase
LKDGKLVERTIEEQTHQVMNNLHNVLKKADATFDDVVKTTIYITKMSLYGKVNEVYSKYFKNNFPARNGLCKRTTSLC